ncbi:iron complex transport system permease protein [Gordonia malaquae]|uniref:Putative ABC transporter permease protein n=2 Tax=Gordonia malaquae TaxID=410332 RepID=M3VAD4_GORML|nr:putative ABC transporter permease protein [Gordonia malaquae NBRC 108250]SED63314.1 iron complex transport system permease protein [Gordonia malaquae]
MISKSRVDFGRPMAVGRGFGGGWSVRVDLRMVSVCALVAAAAIIVGVVTLCVGDLPIAPDRVLAAVMGDGSRMETTVVLKWRMPRVVLALVLGALLGASGAIFQSVTRNPLGSPDVIGFNTGAYTGALVVILLIGQKGYYETAAGALIGGVATALAVYLLAYKRGVQGFRLIIVGIAVSAMLTSINAWILVKADLDRAMSASVWGAGSLNGLRWDNATPVLIVAALCVPLLVVAAVRMPILDLGDDAAKAVGLRAEGTRLYLILVGVVLTAIATAAAGPIAFVSLAAPQIARRLTGAPGVGLAPAAVMGALLLVASDLVAQRAFAPTPLPVGVVTVSVGGIYLVWLLFKEGRRQ